MTTALEPRNKAAILEALVVHGDLSKLTDDERVKWYRIVCDEYHVSFLRRPFDYLWLPGEQGSKRLVLYGRKDFKEQLRALHDVSITGIETQETEDCYTAIVHAMIPAKGVIPERRDSDAGVVWIKGATGQHLANLKMKAITKGKGRVTLSICGAGQYVDESEASDIPGAQRAIVNLETGELQEPPDTATQPTQPALIHAQMADWEIVANDFAARFDEADTRETAEEWRLRYTKIKDTLPEQGRALVDAALARARKRLPGRTP